MKAIPIAVYIVFFIFDSLLFIIGFSIVLLLVAIDFWLTKNVNGRLMVGLRWWNKIQDDGSSLWIFEAMEDTQKVRLSYIEMMSFWIALVVAPIVWILTFLLCFLSIRINYLVLALICFILGCINIVGFFNCARGSRSVLKKKAKKVAVEQGTKAAASAVAASLE